MMIIFSACSFIGGFAPNFTVLLISRMIMGLVEGPFLPVCLAIMMVESSEHRRGVNAGIMQNFFAAILGQTVAPLVLVPLAEIYGWRRRSSSPVSRGCFARSRCGAGCASRRKRPDPRRERAPKAAR